jgi:hypothetical protein
VGVGATRCRAALVEERAGLSYAVGRGGRGEAGTIDNVRVWDRAVGVEEIFNDGIQVG